MVLDFCSRRRLRGAATWTLLTAPIFVSVLIIGLISGPPVLAGSVRLTAGRCELLFSEPKSKKNQAQIASELEFTAAMGRWKTTPSDEVTRLAALNASMVAAKPASPLFEIGRLYQTDEAPLNPLKKEFEFKKQNPVPSQLDATKFPLQYAIEQLEVGANSWVVIKPNLRNGISTKFGAAPLRAKLNPDGSFSELGPLFKRPDHPLSQIDVTRGEYYDLRMLRQTGTTRVLAFSGGQVDAFFVDATGREIPSLASVSGYRFSNVVALSETLYAAEVSGNSTLGHMGQTVIFEYEPVTRKLRTLFQHQGLQRDQENLAALLRLPDNRTVAQAARLENGWMKISLQTHTLRIETTESTRGGRPAEVLVHEVRSRNRGQYVGLADASQTHRMMKVENTRMQAQDEVFDLSLLKRRWYADDFGNVERVTIERYGKDGLRIQNWDIDAADLNSRVFRVRNGFIVQRDSFNTLRMDARTNPHGFPKGPLRGLIYLADSGEVREITAPQNQYLGSVSVVDGHIFAIGTSGTFLNIWHNADW